MNFSHFEFIPTINVPAIGIYEMVKLGKQKCPVRRWASPRPEVVPTVAFIIVSCAIGEVHVSFRSAIHLYFLMFRDFSLEDKGAIVLDNSQTIHPWVAGATGLLPQYTKKHLGGYITRLAAAWTFATLVNFSCGSPEQSGLPMDVSVCIPCALLISFRSDTGHPGSWADTA
jgi:hypothetical protein